MKKHWTMKYSFLLIAALAGIQTSQNLAASASVPAPPMATESVSMENAAPSDPASNPEAASFGANIFPDETGEVFIVMFHRFSLWRTGSSTAAKPYTLSLPRFRSLLQTLYDRNFRPVSLSAFLNNQIKVPAGTTPIVFTFDDGTAGQFHLIRKDGELVVDPNTAVGVLEEFHRTHPDFDVNGTFFINLGLPIPIFDGAGSTSERLTYLIDHGFEIGNHTWSHMDLRKTKSPDEVIAQIGQNQKALHQYLPGYQMRALALPYGRTPPRGWIRFARQGVFEGVPFENQIVLGVGSRPSAPPTANGFEPVAVNRVRAPGRDPVRTDLLWWLSHKTRHARYVSDGNPEAVTVPQSSLRVLNHEYVQQTNQQLITYQGRPAD